MQRRRYSRVRGALGVVLAGWASACSRTPPAQTPPVETPGPTRTPASQAEVSLADLQREVAEIEQTSRAATAPESVASEPQGPAPVPEKSAGTPPPGAADHARTKETDLTLVRTPAVRRARGAAKAAPEGSRAVPVPQGWRQLGFAGSRSQAQQGLSPSLSSLSPAARTRGYTYAFLILNEYLSEAIEKELTAAGVQLLGPHAGSFKARVPVDATRLQSISALGSVEWLGQAPLEQKVEPLVRDSQKQFGAALPRLPVIVSAFDATALEEVRAALAQNGANIGRVDPTLLSVSATLSLAALDAIARLDSVLFIELSRPGGGGHDNSMAVMGVDYIRPGGPGARFSGAPITLGILDTGFMVGGAASTPHQDLNKFGCGRNLTSDAAGVWNDQNGHGTHVLATATGTGSARAQFRGAAIGVGSSGATRVRAAKIWNSSNSGTESQELNGHDFMAEATACNSGRPQVVSESGGAQGVAMSGTDARARKADQMVWENRQTYVVCSGNSGAGGTIWSPGVAKNVLTVGNVFDTGAGQIGDISASSSQGPTGDGRMKPNLVATGTTVTSARAGTADAYTDMSGCSMATPHVSGIATTVMDHYSEFRALPHLLRAHLMSTALLHDNLAPPLNNSAAPDTTRNTFGLGRVSPYVAHWAHFNEAGWATQWAWRTISRDNWGSFDIEVPRAAARLVVVMTWDEPPASAGASAAVDNDLDLWLDHEPFCAPDALGQCGEWASQSYIDNVEYQIIENPPPGRYRLKIINWNVTPSGVPAAIAATIIRGPTAPPVQLAAAASASAVPVGSNFTVDTTVLASSWLLSGVHIEDVGLPAGVNQLGVDTLREDNVSMSFGTALSFSLGTITQGDSRNSRWTFRMATRGPKRLTFRGESENGGTQTRSVTVTGTP